MQGQNFQCIDVAPWSGAIVDCNQVTGHHLTHNYNGCKIKLYTEGQDTPNRCQELAMRERPPVVSPGIGRLALEHTTETSAD